MIRSWHFLILWMVIQNCSESLPEAWPSLECEWQRVRLFWNGVALGLHLMQIFNNLFPSCFVKQQQLPISLLFRKVFRAVKCIYYLSRSNPSAGRFGITLCNHPAWGSAPGSKSPGCEQRTAPTAADLCCESGIAQGSPWDVSQPLAEEHDTRFLLNAILRSTKNPFLEKNSLCLLALPPIRVSPSLAAILLGYSCARLQQSSSHLPAGPGQREGSSLQHLQWKQQ